MNVYKCRHRKTWIVADGNIEWCYECGAIRRMKRVQDTSCTVTPISYWANPTGGDFNPYKVWERKYKIKS